MVILINIIKRYELYVYLYIIMVYISDIFLEKNVQALQMPPTTGGEIIGDVALVCHPRPSHCHHQPTR